MQRLVLKREGIVRERLRCEPSICVTVLDEENSERVWYFMLPIALRNEWRQTGTLS
jgi:hypothetical protein